MNKTIMQIATEKHINKVCIDGMVKDIRQLNKKPFEAIPERVEVMKNSIYNEPILFCYCQIGGYRLCTIEVIMDIKQKEKI